MNVKLAFRHLFSRYHSELYALVGGVLGELAVLFAPEFVTEEILNAINTLALGSFSYAGYRWVSKVTPADPNGG